MIVVTEAVSDEPLTPPSAVSQQEREKHAEGAMYVGWSHFVTNHFHNN